MTVEQAPRQSAPDRSRLEHLVWPVSALLFAVACALTLLPLRTTPALAAGAPPTQQSASTTSGLVVLTVAEVVSTEGDQTSAVLLVDPTHDWVLPLLMPDDCAQRIRRRFGHETAEGSTSSESATLLRATLAQLQARLVRVQFESTPGDEARLRASLTIATEGGDRDITTSPDEGLAAALETGCSAVTTLETLQRHGIRRESLPARVGGIQVRPRHLERL
jgi:hypothetical protein